MKLLGQDRIHQSKAIGANEIKVTTLTVKLRYSKDRSDIIIKGNQQEFERIRRAHVPKVLNYSR